MEIFPKPLKPTVEPGVIGAMDEQGSARGSIAAAASAQRAGAAFPWFALLGMAAGLLVWTWAALLPVCDMMFACGCTWPWAGGNEACNMHMSGMVECPWCSQGPAFHDAVAVAVFISGLAVSGWVLRRRKSIPLAFILGMAGWIAAALLLGIVMVLVTGYPSFLGMPIA